MPSEAYFTGALLEFLADLRAHNTREWFGKNKDRYEVTVRDPMLRFIADLGPRLRRISPHVTADARPVGGSMFRIHRDIRFSRDKSPYKTHLGAHFTHEHGGRDAHAPGFYLHLEPGRSRGGGGLWHPDGPSLAKIRARIVARPGEWSAVRKRIDIKGEALRRVPPGYDARHRHAEDLKLKDFYVMESFSDREVCGRDFMKRFLDVCTETNPLMRFLTAALDLPW
jgi:uncharacterized protein (TIGR02453 family)